MCMYVYTYIHIYIYIYIFAGQLALAMFYKTGCLFRTPITLPISPPSTLIFAGRGLKNLRAGFQSGGCFANAGMTKGGFDNVKHREKRVHQTSQLAAVYDPPFLGTP